MIAYESDPDGEKRRRAERARQDALDDATYAEEQARHAAARAEEETRRAVARARELQYERDQQAEWIAEEVEGLRADVRRERARVVVTATALHALLVAVAWVLDEGADIPAPANVTDAPREARELLTLLVSEGYLPAE